MIEIPYRRMRPSRNLWQVELMGEILSNSAQQPVHPRVAGQRWLLHEHGDLQLRRCCQIEFVEKFRKRLVERLPRRDTLSCLCEGSGAHRSKFPWKKVVLAQSAACRRSEERRV